MDPTDAIQHERRIQTVCLLLLTAVGVGIALYFLRPVLIPFVLALFLVLCFAPAIDLQVQYLHVPRSLALLATVGFGCVLLFLFWLLVWTSVSQLSASAPMYEAQFTQLVTDIAVRLPLERLGVQAEELPSVVQIPDDLARGMLSRLISAIMSVLSNGVLVVIFMVFLLAGHSRTTPPPGSFREQMDRRVKRYILTKVLVSAATGVLVGFILWMFGVELAMVFGVLAFFLNFIPSIGSIMATLLPLPVVVLSPEMSPLAKIMAILIPGGVQFVIGNFLEPKIMGESLDLHPAVVLLGLIFFGMIWGFVGMFLATPIVAVLKIILERTDVTAPVGHLLAGRFTGAREDHG